NVQRLARLPTTGEQGGVHESSVIERASAGAFERRLKRSLRRIQLPLLKLDPGQQDARPMGARVVRIPSYEAFQARRQVHPLRDAARIPSFFELAQFALHPRILGKRRCQSDLFDVTRTATAQRHHQSEPKARPAATPPPPSHRKRRLTETRQTLLVRHRTLTLSNGKDTAL